MTPIEQELGSALCDLIHAINSRDRHLLEDGAVNSAIHHAQAIIDKYQPKDCCEMWGKYIARYTYVAGMATESFNFCMFCGSAKTKPVKTEAQPFCRHCGQLIARPRVGNWIHVSTGTNCCTLNAHQKAEPAENL